MPQTFNQQVFIDGSADETQLRIQASAAQTEPLQTWEDNAGVELVRVTDNGKLQIGDLGVATPEAFIEAGADLTPSSPKPKRGLHALGRYTGALSSALIWAVHELELLGSGGITTLQTALRAKIRNDNSGTLTNAELRAGDFTSVNQKGGSSNRVKQLTGLRAAAETTTGGFTARATAVEALITNDAGGNVTDASAFEVVTPVNSGTITNLYGLRVPDLTQAGNNYAIHTGQGIVHLGGHQELFVLGSSPTTNPPTNFIKLYVKLVNGVPTLYAKDAVGVEYLVGGSGALSAPLTLVGSTDVIQFTVRGASAQTQDLLRLETTTGVAVAQMRASGGLYLWGKSDDVRFLMQGSPTQTNDLIRVEKNDSTPIAQLTPNGGWRIWGQSDDVRLLAKASATQTLDMLRLEASNGAAMVSVSGSGATRIEGHANTTQLTIKGPVSQTADLVQIQTNAGTVINSVSATGEVRINGAGDAVQLVVQESPSQTTVTDIQRWQNRFGTVVASLAAAGTLQVEGLRMSPGAASGKVLISDASGNASWGGVPAPLQLVGANDVVQLYIKAHSTQTNDLLRIERNNGTAIVQMPASGAMRIWGQTDDVRLLVQGSATQTSDLLRIENSAGSPLAQVNANGALYVWGKENDVRLFAQASPTQTSDMLRLETNTGSAMAQVNANGALYLWGKADDTRLMVQGSPTQTNDMLRLELNNGTPIVQFAPSAALRVWGQTDDVRLLAKASATQSQDMLRLEAADGGVLLVVSGSGATRIEGRADNTQFMVKGIAAQTADLFQIQTNSGAVLVSIAGTGEMRINGTGDAPQLVVQESGNQSVVTDIQRWQNRFGTVVASIANNGDLTTSKVITDGFQMAANGGSGKVLTSDASGNGTWETPSVGGVTSVGLTAPSIFAVANSPVTGSGTLALTLTNQVANRFFAGPASGGNAAPTFRALVAADLTSALASPPAIGDTTPAAGTFTALNATTSVTSTVTDSGTNTTPSAGIFRHNSSGTPAANFGVATSFQAESTTTNNRDQGRIRTMWVTATDASRAARMILTAYDTAEREGLAIQASGSAPMIGFLGAAPAVRQTGGVKTAAATYGTNEQSMLQTVYNAMRTYGLLT